MRPGPGSTRRPMSENPVQRDRNFPSAVYCAISPRPSPGNTTTEPSRAGSVTGRAAAGAPSRRSAPRSTARILFSGAALPGSLRPLWTDFEALRSQERPLSRRRIRGPVEELDHVVAVGHARTALQLKTDEAAAGRRFLLLGNLLLGGVVPNGLHLRLGRNVLDFERYGDRFPRTERLGLAHHDAVPIDPGPEPELRDAGTAPSSGVGRAASSSRSPG